MGLIRNDIQSRGAAGLHASFRLEQAAAFECGILFINKINSNCCDPFRHPLSPTGRQLQRSQHRELLPRALGN
jgi:hypothetical protein